MDLEKLEFDTTKKMVTTWWDLVDHYLLAVMFAVSLASFGLQTTQDRLICIPSVNCTNLARNDPVVRKWGELSNMLDICNRSPSYVVLTKMPDRRQYDYIDNECYKKIHWFSAYYSYYFLFEAVVLVAISNFWYKCPDSANALAQCEHLVSEAMMEFIDEFQPSEEEQQKHKIRKELKLSVFLLGYNHEITKFTLSSVTGQYRFRGVVGSIFTIAFLAFNVGCYSHSTEWTQCHLDGHIAFSTGHRFFQCTRSMETYFHIVSILLFVFVSLHLVFVVGSFVWSVTGKRRGPEYSRSKPKTEKKTMRGDAAFLFHLLHNSNYGFVRK